TDALNMAIRGRLFFKPDKPRHVITTWLDHNSVLRPFNALAASHGIEQTRVPCDPATGVVDPDDIRKAIRPDPCLIACVHGSNDQTPAPRLTASSSDPRHQCAPTAT